MTTRLAIFDCDGTLVDSQANICRAMDLAFAAEGLPDPDHHQVRRIVGLSLVEAMRMMLPACDPKFHIVMAEHYKKAFYTLRGNGTLQHEPLYDGLSGLLDQLDKAGWLLAVATGKSDRGLDLCLTHHGIKHRFVSLQTADRHPSKPHPSMVYQALADAGADAAHAVMIGDTSYDILMGVAANVRPIGVDWGYHDAAELASAGAHSIAFSMDELFHHIVAAA